MNNLKGILPINKPQGWTSFDVVNKVKHLINQRGFKIGHLGTLDPMATGVLLVTLGKATKLFDLMQQKTKTYVAEFVFGYETDTLDITGTKIKRTENTNIELKQIEAILPEFIGSISQIPPKYSAKSVNGKRAYDLARENKDFDLKPCVVNIKDLQIIDFKNNVLTLKIVCGSGTYIRALGRDIAAKINSLATMQSLVRTDIDNFNLQNCFDLNELNAENLQPKIIKIDKVINLPTIELGEIETAKILNGVQVKTTKQDGLYKLNDKTDTIALVEVKDFNAKMSIYLA